MQRLRFALASADVETVPGMNDHQVLAAAHVKLKAGRLKVKKDPCDRKEDKNKKYRDFIDAHRSDVATIAVTLKNTVENILGLSALESTFGSSRFAREGNNFFGLHGDRKKPLPNQLDLITAKGDKNIGMATFKDYLACAESFAKTKGHLVVGITDPTQFAVILQQKGGFGIGPGGPLPAYVGDVVNVIGNVAQRLKCT